MRLVARTQTPRHRHLPASSRSPRRAARPALSRICRDPLRCFRWDDDLRRQPFPGAGSCHDLSPDGGGAAGDGGGGRFGSLRRHGRCCAWPRRVRFAHHDGASFASFVRASEKINRRAGTSPPHLVEASEDGILFRETATVSSSTPTGECRWDVTSASFVPPLHASWQMGLRAAANVALERSTFPNACHICEVEIDMETGERNLVA